MNKVLKIVFWVLGGILVLMLFLFLGIKSSKGQSLLTKYANSYIQKKIKTPFRIGEITYSIPDWVSIKQIYIEDESQKVLLASDKIEVDISMIDLLSGNIAIDDILLEQTTINVYRNGPDSTFNYQFLIDAFASSSEAENTTTSNTTSSTISIGEVNVRELELTYRDDFMAINANTKLKKLDVAFDEIDLDANSYFLNSINLDGGYAVIKTDKPKFVLNTNEEQEGAPLLFDLKEFGLKDFTWKLMGNDLGVNSRGRIENANLQLEQLDLATNTILLDKFLLEKSKIAVEVFALSNANSSSGDEIGLPWKINLNQLKVSESNITYDDIDQPAMSQGLDPAHIGLANTNIEISDISYSVENITMEIETLSFKEKSGFDLEQLEGQLAYSDKGIRLSDVFIKTPKSKLDFNTTLKYNSIEDLSSNIENVKFDLDLDNSHLSMVDVLMLQPGIISDSLVNKVENLRIDAEINAKGSLNDFNINKLVLSGLNNTKLVMSGRLKGLNNLDQLLAKINLTELVSSRKDMEVLLAGNSILNEYRIPESFKLSGDIKGNSTLLNLKADLLSTAGNFNINGEAQNLSDLALASYQGKIATEDFDLAQLFVEDMGLGQLSTALNIKASNNFQTVSVEGQIDKFDYENYSYKNIRIDARMADSVLNIIGNSLDPNAELSTNIVVDLKNSNYPTSGKINITKLDVKALNLSDFEDAIAANIDLEMNSVLPEELEGSFSVVDFKLGKLDVGPINGRFENLADLRKVNLKSDFLKAELNGQFDYIDIAPVLISEFNNYMFLDSVAIDSIPPNHNFDITVNLNEHPIWDKLIPGLGMPNGAKLSMSLKNSDFKSSISSEQLYYQDYSFNNLSLSTNGNGRKLDGLAKLATFTTGSSSLYNNELSFELSNNVLNTTFISKDKKSQNIRHLIELSAEKLSETYKIELDKITLEKIEFTSNKAPIYYSSSGGLNINDLVIAHNDEMFTIDASPQELDVSLARINIKPIADFAGYASYGIQGRLGGTMNIQDYMEDFIASGEFTLKSLKVQDVDNGDMEVLIGRLDASQVSMEGSLKGSNANASFNGYLGFDGDLPLDFKANIGRIDAKLFQQFSVENVRKASGFMAGDLKITGTSEKPKVDGKLSFSEFEVTTAYLGAPLKILDQQVYFKGSEVIFDNFIIQDSTAQKLRLHGNVNWSNLDQIAYDLKLNTSNFLLLDAVQGSNDLFFGKANIDANLTITGVGEKPTVGGKVKVNEKSNVTVIMPPDIENLESAGVVSFVPPKDYEPDNSEVEEDTVMSIASLTNEIIIDIETDPKATLSILIDEFSGDNIKIQGTANLTAGFYPSGEIFLIGLYEIAQGSYDFSFEIFKRNFQLEPGGTVVWSGDPYQANINLKAYYEVDVDIQPLLEASGVEVESYNKVPIDVLLNIDGTIENPLITFDLRTSSKAESSVQNLIDNNDLFAAFRKNQSEMNQQVFSLLLFNKFMNDQMISSGSGLSGQVIARQSVSKLLTEQLNVLASDFLGSVGLNFGLNSEQLSSSEGSGYRTDLNVGLRKSFLNDRIKVSVGKNFELENSSGLDQNSAQVIDNLEIAYNITPDGKYAVKVYRNNQYQTVLEGFVLETGVSFVLTSDYDQFRELFTNKKKN